jgi:hypothetical protein
MAERVPRGRSRPPIPPVPREQHSAREIADERRSRKLIMVPQTELLKKTPLPEWLSAYIGFKRKVVNEHFAVVAGCIA